MANSIMVEPARLREAANKINGLKQDYNTSYGALYNAVSEMTSAWEGKDKAAFEADIVAYKEAFVAMEQYLEATVKSLNDTAQDYDALQDQITSAANALRA